VSEQSFIPPQPSIFPHAPKNSGVAIAALVLGILSLVCLGPLAGVLAIICGVIALNSINKANGQLEGRGFAISGIVLGVVSFVMAAVLFAVFVAGLARSSKSVQETIIGSKAVPQQDGLLTRGREAALRSACQNNLKQMGLVCKMFANEHPNMMFPKLSAENGRLMCEAQEIYPEYLTDANVLSCPSVAEAAKFADAPPDQMIDDKYYFYFGYVVENEAQLKLLAEAYNRPDFDPAQDIKVAPGQGNNGGDTLYRLRYKLEIDAGTDPAANPRTAARTPVMMDRAGADDAAAFNHIPGGSNVLFLDGHVEFLRYPSEFPMTVEAVKLLNTMDRPGQPLP